MSPLKAFGFRVRRERPENRFDGMADVLALLHRNGFRPSTVVDGGANRGLWTAVASAVFTDARFHLIEPQPACQVDLTRFAPPRFTVHAVAVTAPGATRVTMAGATADGANTGAYVTSEPGSGDAHTITVEARTLDAILLPSLAAADRVLLKLDVEGHELEVLRGATAVLPFIDVMVLEVQFYRVHDAGPSFGDVFDAVRALEFDLYDIAAMAGRPRDERLRMGDAVFVRRGHPLVADTRWA